MRIAIGADHAGYDFKEEVKKHLESQGHVVQDYGTYSRESCDYPVFAQKVAEAVTAKKEEIGILVCGAGIGMSVAANKVPGIRAALCHDLYTARMAREHNDANILVLPARIVALSYAKEMMKNFFEVKFEAGRHIARLEKITDIEKKYSK